MSQTDIHVRRFYAPINVIPEGGGGGGGGWGGGEAGGRG